MGMNSMTRRPWLIAVVTLSWAGLTWAVPSESPVQAAQTWRGEWRDTKRGRAVPVKIYFPEGAGPFPVIVFSHGLGGSREGYEYLGQYWAAHGYVSVHLQHIGSDESLWKDGAGMQGLRGGITIKTALDRPRDVSFAIDQLQALNKTDAWPLHGRLDLSRIGMAGHSFGANTTLLISGLRLPQGALTLADPRIKCAIAMSAPPPVSKDYDALYGGIKLPMLHMTGTQDFSAVNSVGFSPADRRIPYDHIRGADGYLVTFAGGDHMVFAGRRPGNHVVPSDERNHFLIQQATTAFWDAYLKGDVKALGWLRGAFAKELGGNGVFERHGP
jgi:dienelactone hydrolase